MVFSGCLGILRLYQSAEEEAPAEPQKFGMCQIRATSPKAAEMLLERTGRSRRALDAAMRFESHLRSLQPAVDAVAAVDDVVQEAGVCPRQEEVSYSKQPQLHAHPYLKERLVINVLEKRPRQPAR